MKRQFTILTMTLAMILLFSSCSETVLFETPAVGKSYIRHDDRFYFIGENESWEQQIMFVANDSDNIQYVCYDPLCLHGDDSCPLYIPGLGGYQHIVVDPNSKRTDLYVSASAVAAEKDRGVTDWLFKYDMSTGKKTILIEEWDLGSINTPTLWNEHIYFESLNMYTGETAIYRMNSDASELTLMAEREKNGLYILAIENDTMYLYDDFYNVYQTDADFTDIVQLEFPGIESKKSAGCIAVKNGWLYFGIVGEPYSRTEEVPKFNWNTMKYEGDFVYQTYEIWRVRADDPSMEPEYVCDNTMFSLMMLIQDNVLYTVEKGYNRVGLQYFTVEDETYPAHYIAYDITDLEHCFNKDFVPATDAKKDGRVFILPDGRAWHLEKRTIANESGDLYTQYIAADVTELHENRVELQEETEQLRRVQSDLKALAANIMTVTREEEILNTKMRVHDEMGKCLVAAQKHLLADSDEGIPDSVAAAWQRAVSMIKYSNETDEEDMLLQIRKTCESIHLRFVQTGELPGEERAAYLLTCAVRECVTNAARYADASELYADFTENASEAAVTVYNNGRSPDSEIVEGGGLSTLRRRVERAGGTMTVQSLPKFQLTVTVPKEKEGVL